jgi:hypothetical protein
LRSRRASRVASTSKIEVSKCKPSRLDKLKVDFT